MSTLKVHYQFTAEVFGTAMTDGQPICGSRAKSPSTTSNRDHVDCGNCLRLLAHEQAAAETLAGDGDTVASADGTVLVSPDDDREYPGPAGFIQALGSVLSGTTAKMELDENGRVIGDESPFTVLESIDLTKSPSDDTGYTSFLADTYLAPCQPIGCDNGYHLPGCQFASVDMGAPVLIRDYLPVTSAAKIEIRPMLCDGCDEVRSVRSDDGRTLLCRDCRRMYRKAVRKPHATRTAMHGKPRKPKTGTRRAMRDCMSARKHRANPGNKHHKIHVAVGSTS